MKTEASKIMYTDLWKSTATISRQSPNSPSAKRQERCKEVGEL